MKNAFYKIMPVICIAALSACAPMDSRTATDTVGGAGLGLGVGALVSLTAAGCIPCGAAVGTAIGAGAGFAYDQSSKYYGWPKY